MRRLLVLLIGAALLMSMAGLATAAETKTFSDTTGIVDTGWSGELKLPKFDPAWGRLDRILFSVYGELIGGVSLENRDRRPANVVTTIQATMAIDRGAYGTVNVAMIPTTRVFNALAYDGRLDFAGTSGHTYDDIVVENTGNLILDQAADKNFWSGSGFVTIPVSADGTANGSGAANLVLAFSLLAQGDATVTYEYTPVPEPSSLLALLPGIAGLAGMLKFRKK